MDITQKGCPCKYEFVEKFEHHYSFQVYDNNDNKLWRESFQTIEDAQANIPAGMEVDWGELSSQVDFDRTKTEINKRKIEKAFGFDVDEMNID